MRKPAKKEEKRESPAKSLKKKKIQRRRKNREQLGILETAFRNNPHWEREDVERLAEVTKLSEAQVYKWNWDLKKKLQILPKKVYVYPQSSLYSYSKEVAEMGQRNAAELFLPPVFE